MMNSCSNAHESLMQCGYDMSNWRSRMRDKCMQQGVARGKSDSTFAFDVSSELSLLHKTKFSGIV